MSMKYLLLSICMLLIFNPQVLTRQNGPPGSNSGEAIPITRLRSCLPLPCPFASNSGLDDPLRVTIRDVEAWRKMWKQIYRRGPSPSPELPDINFSKEMVILAALGSRPTGGYAIFIESIYKRDGRLVIKVSSQSAGKNCMVTQAVTQPLDIVRIPKSGMPVVFIENEIIRECK
jgi:hypothetical protein